MTDARARAYPTSKFYSGSLDGQASEEYIAGKRYIVFLDDRTRETYVRDRDRYVYDENGVPLVIAYKLESIEKCLKEAGHEDACRYEVTQQ